MTGYEKWLEQAKRDLAAAENLGQAGFYEHACFECQQAVEKALKALLILQKKKFPKTHVLRELALMAGVLKGLNGLIADLDPDYVLTRYPDSAEKPIKQLYNYRKFRKRLAAAKKALDMVVRWTKDLRG